MALLFLLFDGIRPISDPLRKYLLSILKRKVVRKKEIILRQGEISRYVYFIEKGLVRSVRNDKGCETTAWIMKEGDLVLSVKAFFSQVPAEESIEALEDCVLYYISFEELATAYERYPEFNLHGRILVTHYYQLSEERNQLKTKQALDKYEYLMTKQPELLGRVPDKFLASYLDITPGTFSLQKNRFANRNKK